LEQELTLRIVLEQPPKDVDFGLQKGRGSSYETVLKQRSASKDLAFDFTVGIKPGPTPDFKGPFVQGPPGERFVYIDIGTYAGDTHSVWGRRLKVPLRGITKQMIESGAVLEARTPGTGKDGGPSCATVKSIDWKIKK